MSHRIGLSAIAAAALVSFLSISVVAASPAHADDQRPCVSKREFYGARDFGIPLLPGHDNLSKVPPPDLDPIGRLVLEAKWDVRHLGTTVTHTLAVGPLDRAVPVSVNPLVDVKMYRSCEEPLSELQIYVGYHTNTNMVLWTMRWPTSRNVSLDGY